VDRLVEVESELPGLVAPDGPPIVSAIAWRAWARVVDGQGTADEQRIAWGLSAAALAEVGEIDAARDALRRVDALEQPGVPELLTFDGVRIRIGAPARERPGLTDVPALVQVGRAAEAEQILDANPVAPTAGPLEQAALAAALAALGHRDRLERLLAAVAGDAQVSLFVHRSWLEQALRSGVDLAPAVDAMIAFRRRGRITDLELVRIIDGADPLGRGAAVAPLAHAIRATAIATDDGAILLELFAQALERGDDAEADLLDTALDRIGDLPGAWRPVVRAIYRGTVAEGLAAIAAFDYRYTGLLAASHDDLVRGARAEMSATLWARSVAAGFTAETEAQLAAAWCAAD
jgi:hypothetical protein